MKNPWLAKHRLKLEKQPLMRFRGKFQEARAFSHPGRCYGNIVQDLMAEMDRKIIAAIMDTITERNDSDR